MRAFYRDVRSILKDALKGHVHGRFRQFSEHLTAHAKAIPDNTLSQVRAQIEQTAVDIRAAAEAAVAGQKEAFERTATELVAAISSARADVLELLWDEFDAPGGEPTPEPIAAQKPIAAQQPIGEPARENAPKSIRARAKQYVERHILQNGAKGWPFPRIFPRQYFQAASEAWLIDPYLAMRHQRRNLAEFVVALLECAKLKTLHIITKELNDPSAEADKQFFELLDRDAFDKGGMRIKLKIEEDLHDRFFILDNGFVFKLGRGLDIFKPVAGLATRDPSLRQVRSCEIDIFGPPAIPS